MERTFKVRDFRNKHFFMIDDAYLNGYAKLCGNNATLVYMALCRHASKDQESFPSIEKMAEKLGVERKSVMRGVKNLIKWNIIRKERHRKKDAKWLNNTYYLLDKSEWKSKSQVPVGDMESQVPNEGVAKSQISTSQVPLGDTKETHTKETHTKETCINSDASIAGVEISAIIHLFKEVNPSIGKYYNNTSQRSAIERMIKEYGRQKLEDMIRVLPVINAKQYWPKSTTPCQLENNIPIYKAKNSEEKNKKPLIVKT